MTRPLTFISLFSGIGGFDLGFERAGMACVAQVEWNKDAQQVLARHWPEVARFKDVKDVGRGNLPAADVLCGGFPCQDVSVAGRRAGLAGERSGLWFEFHRIIGELHPRAVVIENVPGLLSSNGGRDFAVILHGLVEFGYRVAWRILDAQHFGLAQRRKRLFIVASLGTGAAAEILFERESGEGHPAPRRETGKDIAATVAARAGKGGFTDPVSDNVIIAPELSPALTSEGHDSSEDGRGRHALVVAFTNRGGSGALAETLRANSGGALPPAAAPLNDASVIACDLQQVTSVTNRSQPGPIAPTLSQGAEVIAFTERTRADGRNFEAQPELAYALTNPGSGGRTHSRQIAGGFGVRRLTPTECARLQGFPDDWNAWLSDSARYRQFGNAVAVPVAEWIGRRIVEVLA